MWQVCQPQSSLNWRKLRTKSQASSYSSQYLTAHRIILEPESARHTRGSL
jgi:hypothetical protein